MGLWLESKRTVGRKAEVELSRTAGKVLSRKTVSRENQEGRETESTRKLRENTSTVVYIRLATERAPWQRQRCWRTCKRR